MGTFAIVGEGTLALRCADRAAADLELAWVCSPDGSLASWARGQDAEHVRRKAELGRLLVEHPVDYLFSINNPWILDEEMLAGARRLAVNYHDSLLRRHVGLHATSWAIFAGETQHGVTLHTMGVDVDTGDALVQRTLRIDPRETAATLNAKCYEAAAEAFDELIDRIVGDAVERTPLPTQGRTASGLYARPSNAGMLDFSRSADEADRTVRALSFGYVPNHLAFPKVQLPSGEILVPTRSELGDRSGPPGTVLEVRADAMHVATRDRSLWLFDLHDLRGRRVRLDVTAGTKLPIGDRCEWDDLVEDLAVHERFWRKRLLRARPFVHPYAQAAAERRLSPWLELELDLADEAEARVVLAAYLRRVRDDEETLTVAFSGSSTRVGCPLFASGVPFFVPPSCETLAAFTRAVDEERARVVERRTHMIDVLARHQSTDTLEWGVGVIEADGESDAPLAFSISPHAIRMRWCKNAIPDERAFRIGDQVTCVHRALTSGSPVESMSLIADAESARLVYELNDTEVARPDLSLQSLAFRWADETPDAPAVQFERDQLSYAQLALEARALAGRLRAAGVSSGDSVAVIMERTLALPVALLGILEAGAAYVPIDRQYPEKRIRETLKDSGAKWVVTTRATRATLPDDVPQLVVELGKATTVAALPESPRGIAYIIYTSGSTGVPKGVEVGHAELVNHAFATSEIYGLTNEDRGLHVAPISFDLAAEELYPTWAVGACVVIAPPALMESLDGFTRFVDQMGLTVLNLSTAFFHGWVAYLDRVGRGVPSSLRSVTIGTEAASVKHIQRFAALAPQVRVFNAYGTTETTVTSTVWVAEGEIETIPIGRPIANTQAFVLDRGLRPRPVGMVGELCIGGVGVARGYRNRPELTEERFVDSPFSASGRMYRTGDLAYLRDDGNVMFVGRRDAQVKVRGFRVELGEVEATLDAHPEVRRCVVVARKGTLWAYAEYLAEPPDTKAIRAFLARRLPAHEIPAGVTFLESLPLTPNGKVDRNALPEPEATTSTEYVMPQSEVEKTICAAFQRVLGLQRVGRNDGFFALGGDSLSALTLFGELERQLGVALPLPLLLAHPTPARLATVIDERSRRTDEFQPLVPLRKIGSEMPFFCVTGTGGQVLVFRELAHAMSPNRPFWGLQACGVEGRRAPDTTIEAMAARNVAAMLERFQRGPFVLGGYSGGGIVAYEMAQQLAAAGQRVLRLVVLDTDPGLLAPESTTDKLDRIRSGLVDGGAGFIVDWAKGRLAWERERRVLRTVRLASRTLGRPIPRRYRERLMNEAWYRARENYRIQPWPGIVELVRSEEPAANDHRDLGWSQLVDEVRVHDVLGNHATFLKSPQVEVLAEALETILGAASRDRAAIRRWRIPTAGAIKMPTDGD